MTAAPPRPTKAPDNVAVTKEDFDKGALEDATESLLKRSTRLKFENKKNVQRKRTYVVDKAAAKQLNDAAST